MKTQTILLVDDDKALCALLGEYLADEGFNLETCHDGNSGLERALTSEHDLVILDVMLPGCNGFEVLKQLRRKSDVPVLMLTARGDEVDRIVGLEIGADDYLGKPFNPRELVARMRAIFRRLHPQKSSDDPAAVPSKLCVDDIELEHGTRRVLKQGRAIDLTAVEYNLLTALLQSAGRVVSREELNQEVLGRAYSPYDRSIDVHISKLRKKLGEKVGQADRIQAIRGEGYLYSVLEKE
ncbi:MAG: response regulator transcription factor [Desulfobacteraceae bacterium]|jgi:two-component system, OmpR family, response regulator CpxR